MSAERNLQTGWKNFSAVLECPDEDKPAHKMAFYAGATSVLTILNNARIDFPLDRELITGEVASLLRSEIVKFVDGMKE